MCKCDKENLKNKREGERKWEREWEWERKREWERKAGVNEYEVRGIEKNDVWRTEWMGYENT